MIQLRLEFRDFVLTDKRSLLFKTFVTIDENQN